MTLDEAIAHYKERARNYIETLKPFGDKPMLEATKKYIARQQEFARKYEQLASWLTELQERREADRWIPVSERLPEPQKPNDDIYNTHCSDFVLVCIEWWNGQKVIEIASYDFDDEEWEYHGSDESEVIAWKPLPEPYKESEDE